jgi:hypothetical protein
LRHAKIALICLGIAMASPLAGCVVAPPPRPHVVYIQKAPPAPLVEVQPAAPGPAEQFIWKPGHWRWDGREYIWRRGEWELRPAHVVEWIAPHWEHHPDGWFFIEGHYR